MHLARVLGHPASTNAQHGTQNFGVSSVKRGQTPRRAGNATGGLGKPAWLHLSRLSSREEEFSHTGHFENSSFIWLHIPKRQQNSEHGGKLRSDSFSS